MLSEAPLHVSNVALVDPSDGLVAEIGCCEVCTATAMCMCMYINYTSLTLIYVTHKSALFIIVA